MRRLLNTLYVTTQGTYLARDGESVAVKQDEIVKLRIPIHNLHGIVCMGRVSCSPWVMDLCGRNKVVISYLTEAGRFLGRFQGPTSGNVLLRRAQFRAADQQKAQIEISRRVVTGKIANSRAVLLRAKRETTNEEIVKDLSRTIRDLERILNAVGNATDVQIVRGHEGEAARAYFAVFNHLIVQEHEAFQFRGRNRRPPLDNVNALLSFVYTLLAHDVESALETVGLDPDVGFLHKDRPGRAGLALDMMEELRAVLADRLTLSLINRGQVKPTGFVKTDSGAVQMIEQTRKVVIQAYQKRKQEEIRHPFLNERISFGLIPHVQALLLARYIRGDLDGYPPFLWR